MKKDTNRCPFSFEVNKQLSAGAGTLCNFAAGAADSFFLLDAALFGFGDEPAFAADVTKDSAAGNGLAEAAVKLLLRLVGA